MIIAVIGAAYPSPEIAVLAEKVGKEIGKRGATLVSGGLGGVMEAASKGAKTEGALTIGILPGSNPSDANPWVDIPICTGLSYARNVIVVKTGWSVIAVGGAYGTLSEIGHALGEGIPVIGLRTWNMSNSEHGLDNSICIAKDPVDAVSQAIGAAKTRHQSLLGDC